MGGFPIYIGPAISLLFFLGVGFICAHIFHIEGDAFRTFMIVMAALGVSSSAFFYFFQNKIRAKNEAKKQAAAGGDAGPAASGKGSSPEVDQLIKDADQKLGASGGATVGNLPLIFVIGDQGTTKTSVVVHSGLDPELLAGQVYQNNDVVSTNSANVWFARNVIFVEAGGRLLAQPQSWTRLVNKIQPGKLKSALSKGEQSPRAVLLCFDCESFTKQGAAEQIAATGRYLHARLGEISQLLGISFPVYVLFTRADRMAFFGDFVRNLNNNDEATQVFGVTLPMRQGHGGVYAEEESRRLTQAFNDLLYSLCDRRVDYLPREHDPEKLPGAYEFPREFRKIRSSLVQLLVDVCRPSQLRSSPFLRGFYFSGVRPVVISDVAPAAARPAGPQKTFEAGATRMFRAGMDLPQAVVSPQGGGARRVPQWLFLSHLFTDVVLADKAAMAASGSSAKISGVRRLMLGLTSLVFLFFTGMFSCSFINNRSIEKDAISNAKDLSTQRVTGAQLPAVASLQKLDLLRGILLKLSSWKTDGHPTSYSWFLYSGDDLLPQVRSDYYKSYRDLLFGQVQGNWIAYLNSTKIPPGDTDDYGFGYDTLKAYLLSTSEWKRTSDKSYQDFLANTLFTRWPAGRDPQIDKPMSDLAKLQFDFHAHDLPNGNPYPDPPQADTVAHARTYLSQFNATDRVYQALLSEAAKKGATIVFNRDYPGSDRIIRNNIPTPAAFTKNAWPYMMALIADAEKRFGGERWVLGDAQGAAVTDWAATKRQLADKYLNDYINAWRRFVKNCKFQHYVNIEDANTKLQIIDANDSPLLRVFQVVSANTGVDPRVKAVFDGAPRVVPPDSPGPTSDKTTGYMTSLNGLQQAVSQAVGKTPDATTSAPIQQAAGAATTAHFQITNPFQPDPGPFVADLNDHVDKELTQLLKDPIDDAVKVSVPDIAAGLNGAGAQFCRASAFRKFPIGPLSAPDATLAEIDEIFRPKEGTLAKFLEGQLKQYITCTPSGCTPTGSLALNQSFVGFLSEAYRFSAALYKDGPEPKLAYTITPRSDQVDSFIFTVDGASSPLKSGATGTFTWAGSSTRFGLNYKLAGGGSPLGVAPWDGLWSPMRFFASADHTTVSGSVSTFLFTPRQGQPARPIVDAAGRPLEYSVNVDAHGAPAVFSSNYWSHLRCISTVAPHK
jgi:type VI secretion system protein ImpL